MKYRPPTISPKLLLRDVLQGALNMLCFRRPGARNFISPVSLPGIEQIISVKLLGIHLSATLSAAAHV